MSLEFHNLIHTILKMCPCKIKFHYHGNVPCPVEDLSESLDEHLKTDFDLVRLIEFA